MRVFTFHRVSLARPVQGSILEQDGRHFFSDAVRLLVVLSRLHIFDLSSFGFLCAQTPQERSSLGGEDDEVLFLARATVLQFRLVVELRRRVCFPAHQRPALLWGLVVVHWRTCCAPPDRHRSPPAVRLAGPTPLRVDYDALKMLKDLAFA
jgi:hypothetical protein